jgi:hypothetical protein
MSALSPSPVDSRLAKTCWRVVMIVFCYGRDRWINLCWYNPQPFSLVKYSYYVLMKLVIVADLV